MNTIWLPKLVTEQFLRDWVRQSLLRLEGIGCDDPGQRKDLEACALSSLCALGAQLRAKARVKLTPEAHAYLERAERAQSVFLTDDQWRAVYEQRAARSSAEASE